MNQDRTLARGGRIPGAVVLGVLALLSLGWIIRDFAAAEHVTDVWNVWQGSLPRARNGLWATTWLEPALLVAYAVCAATVLRSSSAAGILGSAGAVTVLLRLPGVWTLNADWLAPQDGTLRGTALFTAVAALVLGAGLVVIALAGRRPVRTDGPAAPQTPGAPPAPGPAPRAFGPPGSLPAEAGPAHPVRGGAVLAFAMLVVLSFLTAGQDIYLAVEEGGEVYWRHFTGDQSLARLLQVPGGWTAWVFVALMLTAAFAALADRPLSRPLGMFVAGLNAASGFFGLTLTLVHLPAAGSLVLLPLLRFAAAVLVIVGLARRDDGGSYYDDDRAPGGAPDWAAGWGVPGQAPAWGPAVGAPAPGPAGHGGVPAPGPAGAPVPGPAGVPAPGSAGVPAPGFGPSPAPAGPAPAGPAPAGPPPAGPPPVGAAPVGPPVPGAPPAPPAGPPPGGGFGPPGGGPAVPPPPEQPPAGG